MTIEKNVWNRALRQPLKSYKFVYRNEVGSWTQYADRQSYEQGQGWAMILAGAILGIAVALMI